MGCVECGLLGTVELLLQNEGHGRAGVAGGRFGEASGLLVGCARVRLLLAVVMVVLFGHLELALGLGFQLADDVAVLQL